MPLLFSYGTLQQDGVQLATFGRKLSGQSDALPGFELTVVLIEDAAVIATSGKAHHPIVKFNGNPASRVPGTVFQISDAELESADRYEVSAYQRIAVTLASGQEAWAYVSARFVPDDYERAGD